MVERMLSMHEAQGSIPCSSTFFFFGSCFHSHSSLVAEHLLCKQKVVGSSPACGFLLSCVQQRSWSSGYDGRLPSGRPGFDSRRAHFFFLSCLHS
jgi:hypothetical protein